MTFLNYASTAAAFGIPLTLLLMRRHSILIFWIGLSCFVDIFNSVAFVTMTPTRVAGAVLLPYVLRHAAGLLPNRQVRLLGLLVGLLFTLGIIYGHLFPWPDVTGTRNWRYVAEGRSLIYFGSYTLEVIVAVYLAIHLREAARFRALLVGVLAGSALSALGMALERAFHFDFYYWIVSWDPRELSLRPRGFNYEPRGGGYATTIGLLALLIPSRAVRNLPRFLLLAAVAYGFHLAASISALILLVTSILGLGLFHAWACSRFSSEEARLERRAFFVRTGVLVTLLATYGIELPSYQPGATNPTQNAWEYVVRSKSSAYLLQDNWLGKFEIFDSLALGFFYKHPGHLLLGAGPGLISLPISTPELRIDSIPHIGLVLMISNFGLLGLALWSKLNLELFLGLFRSGQRGDADTLTRLTFFAGLAVFYVLQAKAFYVLALGTGLAHALTLQRTRPPRGASPCT